MTDITIKAEDMKKHLEYIKNLSEEDKIKYLSAKIMDKITGMELQLERIYDRLSEDEGKYQTLKKQSKKKLKQSKDVICEKGKVYFGEL